mgnify:CR=1 FL=1
MTVMATATIDTPPPAAAVEAWLGAFERALAIKPADPSARLNLALSLERGGFPLDAAAELETLLNAAPDNVHDTNEQYLAFVGSHGREFAVGSPNQKPIELHINQSLDIVGEAGKVDACVGREWRDGDIEYSLQPRLRFAFCLHFVCL